MPNQNIQIAGIQFTNPVFVSAGTFGYGDEFIEVLDVNQLGAIVTKTLTLNPREGNPFPRIIPTPSGMLNSIGLQNIGLHTFISDKLPKLKSLIQVPIIISIMANSVEEFVELIRVLNEIDSISAIELNLSCPNVKSGGISFSIDPKLTEEVVKGVKKISKHPIFAKLTPNVTDIIPIAKAAELGGADAISAVNTFIGMSIDTLTKKSRLGTKTGGLSGPAIKPLALYHVYQICKSVKIPVIGMGGILTGDDAIEYIIAGATAISIGTGNFVQPTTPLNIINEIQEFMVINNINSLSEIRGTFLE